MSFFSDIKQADKLEEVKDTVGGGYSVIPSGVYDVTIKFAYTGQSKHGAKSITFGFDVGGREITETMYVTNRNKETFYTKDGKKYPLPAYTTANDISRLALKGKQITELKTEEKVLELYDFDTRGKKKTAVDCLTALHGQQVKLGIKQVKAFKQVKNHDGKYVDGDEIRESNVIDKAFHATNSKTVNELLAKKESAEFVSEWKTKWENKVDDKTGGREPAKSTSQATAETASIDDDVFGD